MNKRIDIYIFLQILKSCSLIFFIFITIAWLMQLTRLFTLSNLIQIDILNIIYLSFFLLPNLFSVILPFILIFGILLCFIKLNKDKELIAIFSLGLDLMPFKNSMIMFSFIILIFYSFLNFFISPKIYEIYKFKEFELRNTLNLNKVVTTNFLKINDGTTLDFKKNKNSYEDIFINFKDNSDNIIFAKNGKIKTENNNIIFKLKNGFKLNINGNEIEKLEFTEYTINFNNETNSNFNNYDRNSLTLFDDLYNKDYLNVSFKVIDILLSLIIIYIFYINNLKNNNFSVRNNLIFIISSLFLLIFNQLLKNSETNYNFYIFSTTALIITTIICIHLKNRYE